MDKIVKNNDDDDEEDDKDNDDSEDEKEKGENEKEEKEKEEIETNPPKGKSVKEGTEVTLILSKGEEAIKSFNCKFCPFI